METDDSLLSVGIDVGTTSTHMTVSRLELANSSVINQAPRQVISNRQIIYQSDIYLTPLTPDGVIDAPAVAGILEGEFKKANITYAMIKTGAAIITGETARLRNAKEVIRSLAHLAGELVVESAGPHLEGVLAARGVGADRVSKLNQKVILNADIGGGTTNIAIYQNGVLKGSCCLNIGGRFLRFDAGGTIEAITSYGRKFLQSLSTRQILRSNQLRELEVGGKPSLSTLEVLADALAECLIGFLTAEPNTATASIESLVEDRSDIANLIDGGLDELWFSGGVAQLMLYDAGDDLEFNDMGVLLARCLKTKLKASHTTFHVSEHAIRATVLGASMHTLKLSGSTIGLHRENLPLRNVKAVSVDGPASVALTLRNHDLEWSTTTVALAMSIESKYNSIKNAAEDIARAFESQKGKEPLVILLAEDCGMALGQMLRRQLPNTSMVVVDGVTIDDGDYIDIGQPIGSNSFKGIGNTGCTATLPVVVKTLVFPE